MRSVQLVAIVHEGPTVVIGTYASLMILAFHAEVDQAALVAAEATQRKLLAKYPSVVLITVIPAGVPLPAEGTRAIVVDSFKRMASKNAAAATTVVGDGFWASAMRSTLTALNIVVRPPCPQRTFAGVQEAITWLTEFEPSLSAPGLAREIEAIRGKRI